MVQRKHLFDEEIKTQNFFYVDEAIQLVSNCPIQLVETKSEIKANNDQLIQVDALKGSIQWHNTKIGP